MGGGGSGRRQFFEFVAFLYSGATSNCSSTTLKSLHARIYEKFRRLWCRPNLLESATQLQVLTVAAPPGVHVRQDDVSMMYDVKFW